MRNGTIGVGAGRVGNSPLATRFGYGTFMGLRLARGIRRSRHRATMADYRIVLPLGAAAAVGGFLAAHGFENVREPAAAAHPSGEGSAGVAAIEAVAPGPAREPTLDERLAAASEPQVLLELRQDAISQGDAATAARALRRLADISPEAAGAWAASLGGDESGAIDGIVERLAERDPALATVWIHEHLESPEARDRAHHVVFSAVGNSDLARRVAMLDAIDDVFEHEPAVRQALASIRPDQVGPAIDWILADQRLSDPGAVLVDLSQGWGRTAYDALAASVDRIADASLRERVLGKAMEGLGESNPERLASVATVLQPGAMRDYLLGIVVLAVFDSDRSQALDLLSYFSDPDAAVAAAESVAEAWADRSPQDAVEWAASLIDSGIPPMPLRTAVRSWASEDQIAAAAWIAGRGPGPVRDNAAEALAVLLAGRDPAAAFEWASSIDSARLRESALREVARVLWEASPAQAALILREAGLPPAVLEQIDPSLLLDDPS